MLRPLSRTNVQTLELILPNVVLIIRFLYQFLVLEVPLLVVLQCHYPYQVLQYLTQLPCLVAHPCLSRYPDNFQKVLINEETFQQILWYQLLQYLDLLTLVKASPLSLVMASHFLNHLLQCLLDEGPSTSPLQPPSYFCSSFT